MKSYELMRLLIPDNKVKAVSEFTGLTTSLLYMERRESGKDLTATGTRNTIDRLDLFCEWNLSRNPDIVRILGERYLQKYRRHISPTNGPMNEQMLLASVGDASRLCGQAVAALAGHRSIKECTVEVAEAKAALESALALVTALEDQE